MNRPSRLKVEIEKRLAGCDLRIALEAGAEIFVLFGRSGAGKTQTLNAIAGLATPDAGEIALDGEIFFRRRPSASVINLPARARRVGYVFQHYALFPHLTALENVGFALRRNETARARSLLERMNLGSRADRYPAELSGGEQQRVAIARALAAAPRLLLLDEPFSALDAMIRDRLHEDLRALQAETGLVVLYVTHNLDDAFAAGHRLAVISRGRIRQLGAPEEVFRRPRSLEVLRIMNVPNGIEARLLEDCGDHLRLDWNGLQFDAPRGSVRSDGRVAAYIHPEEIEIVGESESGRNIFSGLVIGRRPGRSHQSVRVGLENGGALELSFASTALAPREGERLRLRLGRDKLTVLEADDEEKENRDES